jgi:flagellar motor component MotA
MLDLFNMGGPLFMSLISIAQIGMFLAIGMHQRGKAAARLYVREAGLLALALGILGQLIGLFEAFKAIEAMGDISTALLVGGLKISMITTLYGLIGFIISRIYLLFTANKAA